MASIMKPRVLLISLHLQPFFDDMFKPLLEALSAKADVTRADDVEVALNILCDPSRRPVAVLLTDESLALYKNGHIWEAVLKYVHEGGTAVAMGHFPCFVAPNEMENFFARARLAWTYGPYHRTTVVLNHDAVGEQLAASLPSQYSQKAVFVQHVAPADVWYATGKDSAIESPLFPSAPSAKAGESAVAFTRVGGGRLGYVGDVNAETASVLVVLAMCGLLRPGAV